jgi:hypothetical protein
MNEKCSLLTALAIVLIVAFLGIGAEAAPLAGGSTSCQSYAGSNACRRKEGDKHRAYHLDGLSEKLYDKPNHFNRYDRVVMVDGPGNLQRSNHPSASV